VPDREHAIRRARFHAAIVPPAASRRLRRVADWATISGIATAGGTLVLAGATFASVTSANRAARVAERSLLAGLRPLLMPSRLQDAAQKVGFADDHWVTVEGGRVVAQAAPDAVYLVMSVRNVGTGMAVLHGWRFLPRPVIHEELRPELDEFIRLSRDLYVPVGETGFWQGSFRDPASAGFQEAAAVVEARQPFTVELLYGDFEGGQRTITRFGVRPLEQGDVWLASVGRHTNVDRADPR
jgi:hypothetical protein